MTNTNGLKYHTLPGNVFGRSDLIRKYNDVYGFWKNVWSDTLAAMKLPELDKDQFLRQNYVCFLTLDEKIIASHLYSVFDIRTQLAMECKYFASAADEIKGYCESNRISTLMTQEYLAVAPEMRKSNSGLSLPEIVIGLGTKLMSAIDCDSTVGTVRAGAPSVERICKELSADLLESTIYRYDIPHKIFIVSQEKVTLPGDTNTQKLIEQLWDEKTDHVGLTHTFKPAKAA